MEFSGSVEDEKKAAPDKESVAEYSLEEEPDPVEHSEIEDKSTSDVKRDAEPSVEEEPVPQVSDSEHSELVPEDSDTEQGTKRTREKSEEIQFPPEKKLKIVVPFDLTKRGKEACLLFEVKNPLTYQDVFSVAEVKQLFNNSPTVPTWIQYYAYPRINHSIYLIFLNVPDTNLLNFDSPFIKNNLDHPLALVHELNLREEVAASVSIISEPEQLVKKFGSLHTARRKLRNACHSMMLTYNILNESEEELSSSSLNIIDFVMTLGDLHNHHYPTPSNSKNYTVLHNQYLKVKSTSNLMALDTEGIGDPTRISIVDQDSSEKYDRLIDRPGRTVESFKRFKDYEQKYDSRRTLEEVKSDIQDILQPDVVMVGHSLQNDLHSLQMTYPHIADVSLLYNLTKDRSSVQSLKKLCHEFAPKETPNHYPLNDSKAAMTLLKRKLSDGLDFGNEHLKISGKLHLKAGTSSVISSRESIGLYRSLVSEYLGTDTSGLKNIEFHRAESHADVLEITKTVTQKKVVVSEFIIPDGMSSEGSFKIIEDTVKNIYPFAKAGTAFFLLLHTSTGEQDAVYYGMKYFGYK